MILRTITDYHSNFSKHTGILLVSCTNVGHGVRNLDLMLMELRWNNITHANEIQRWSNGWCRHHKQAIIIYLLNDAIWGFSLILLHWICQFSTTQPFSSHSSPLVYMWFLYSVTKIRENFPFHSTVIIVRKIYKWRLERRSFGYQVKQYNQRDGHLPRFCNARCFTPLENRKISIWMIKFQLKIIFATPRNTTKSTSQ